MVERILQVSYAMDRGGAETLAMNLMRYMDPDRIAFDFLVHPYNFEDGAYSDEIRELGGEIFKAPRFTKHPTAYNKFMKQFFAEHRQFNVVHAHFLQAAAPVYMYWAKRQGLFVAAHAHNDSDGSLLKNSILSIAHLPLRYFPDYYFGCSRAAGSYFFGKDIVNSRRFRVIKNAFDLQLFAQAKSQRERLRKQFGLNRKFVIGHVGRFHEQKNHDFIIEIFKQIHQQNGDAVLLLVGDGPLESSIREKVHHLGLDSAVIFAGSIGNVYDYYSVMDVFLFPSRYEGLPFVLVEAFSIGLPIVMSSHIAREEFDFITQQSHVQLLSLQDSKAKWLQALQNAQNYGFYDRSITDTRDAGFDIRTVAAEMTDFYLRAASKHK